MAATSWAAKNPLPSRTSDTFLASTPPPVIPNNYPVGLCYSPTSASKFADASQAFNDQLGPNIPAMKQGGNSYTQVYKGGKLIYHLDLSCVNDCTLQYSQDPNNLMPNNASLGWAYFFYHAYTDCKSYRQFSWTRTWGRLCGESVLTVDAVTKLHLSLRRRP